MQNDDRIVSHQSLLEKVWGREYIDATDYLKSHIQHLRQKLGENADDATRIINERGVGYRFVTSRT